MRAATPALPFVMGISVIACNAITGIGDLERGTSVTTQNPDASAPCGGADLTSDANNCGTCGHACGTGNFCSSSSCVQGCTGGLLYVSPTGVDTNDGCALTAPLKTISHAVSIAKAQGFALVQEVHVCKGVYAEPQITVDFKSSLRGSYDCTSWKRTATFGYPTFDPTNLTEIDSSATTGASITTIAVGGSALDATSIIDGFSIKGSSKGSTSIALALNGGAPSIQNDQIIGGTFSEATSAQGSIGIEISGGASPEITTSSINGGGGITTSATTSAVGSIGVSVGADSGSPNIHGATIDGGSGSAPTGNGSIGIAVNGGAFPAASAIRANTITGGTGKIGTSGVASVGVVSIAPGNVELDGNVILGGGGSCAKASGNCSSFGIVAGVGSLIVRANKIYGGDATGTTNGGSAGITASGLKSFVVENNMIHGGNESSATTHGTARAIEVNQIAAPQIRNNTFFAGNAGSGASSDIVIDTQVSALVMDNNLFALPTGATVPAFGITLACSANLIASVRNNVFLDPQNVMIYGGNGVGTGTCTGTTTQTFTTVDDAQTFLSGASSAANVVGNVRLTASCGAEGTPTCVASPSCSGPLVCTTSVIAGWSTADSGFALLQSDGWKINPVCAVSEGGLDVTATLKTDFYGAARTKPVSVGAQENDAACL